MKKLILVVLAVAGLASARAGERSLKDWLKDLDARIHRTDDRRKGRLVAAASVRGDKAGTDNKLYWKGRRSNGAVTAEELDAFKAAVALAQEGKSAEAKASLDAFVAAHPKSPMKEDAEKTLALLKEEAPAAPAPATEAK